MADIRYLLQHLGGQKESSARNKRSTIPAVELAAANVRIDKTCKHRSRVNVVTTRAIVLPFLQI